MPYKDCYRCSLEEADRFWTAQASRIDWHRPFERVLDYSDPPFSRWFVGGETNLCHNAVDRHLAARDHQAALIYISTELDRERVYTYRELHTEVQAMAAILQSLGVVKGDRVLIYLPMVPEAIFAMLATVRLGAIHSVVFGGFAAHSLATRIDDAQPKVMLIGDAGLRGGKVIPYKPLVDEALRIAEAPPDKVLIVNRGLDQGMTSLPGRDFDYGLLRSRHLDTYVPCTWVESSHPSYILYTSGTTGKPKGVQRDTGGHAVALASSMELIYSAHSGDTYFATSDIGWVVGHSYIAYGPLIHGMTTILYEGLPTRPDPGVWWRIVQDHRVTVMFSSPTAIRVLKRHDPAYLHKYDLSSLRHLFLAGEPLDEPTNRWIAGELGKPVYDHYWQTETGWPILSAQPGIEAVPSKFGSPSFPVYGYDVRLLDAATGADLGPGRKGVVCVVPPLPPGCLSTVWGQDESFRETYFSSVPNRLVYTTFDWGIRDEDGYYYILGRTDDVINVSGHRLGTREIEEAISTHAGIAEVAVVGVADELKGQAPIAFAVVKDAASIATDDLRAQMERELLTAVNDLLGPIARPGRIYFVAQLPKTRSGKVLRRSIRAAAEGSNPGDLTTLDDPSGMQQIQDAIESTKQHIDA